jgi:hypothetical protein
MSYTDKETNTILERRRTFNRKGQPEKAAALMLQYENEVDFDKLLGSDEDKQAEVDEMPHPPRSGPGSGKDAWQSFAKEISDLEDDVIDKMKREEIVQFLEEADLIEVEDPTEGNG